jgi:hypothetical protein
MEGNISVIETKVQLHYRYMLPIFGSLSLPFIIGWLFMDRANQLSVLIVCVLVFIILMVFLVSLIKRLTKRIVFDFGKIFSIRIFDPKTGELEEEHQYNYAEIRSCFISSGTVKTCTFKLNFLKNRSIKLILYSAEGEFTDTEHTVGFKIFQNLCKQNRNIKPVKPFFTTLAGKILLATIVILFIADLTLYITNGLDPKSFLITLPTTASMLLIVFGTSRRQQRIYDKMIGAENSI